MQRFVRPEPIDGSTRVQRVFDTQHVAHRACRRVSTEQGSFDEIRDRLRRMSKVTHPHLARIVAVGEEEGELRVITEWLPGGSIAEHPDPGRLLVGVADALYALHREGLAHGHVHPRSLVFDGEGVLKLVDGGVCDGSVIEDLESFGAALKGLYAGRPMPAALATVAVQASAGAFGDAHELKLALEEAVAMAPPPADRSIEPDVHVVDTAPPVRVREAAAGDEEEEPETRWLLLLLLAGLLAVLLVLVAAVVGWFSGVGAPPPEEPAPVQVHEAPRPAPAPSEVSPPSPAPVVVAGHPEPAPAPVPAPAEEPLPEAAGPTTAEVHVSDPGAVVVAVERLPTGAVVNVPAPVVPQPPPPAPVAPAPPPASGWRVVTSPGKAHPTTTLVLDARDTVKDRLDRAGRPRLEIRCQEHRLTVDLDPGVRSVEAVPSEVGAFSMTALVKAARDGGAADDAKLRMVDGDARLYFPTPERWVGTLGAGNAWSMSYTPFASPSVVAVFDTAGLDVVLPEIRKYCRL